MAIQIQVRRGIASLWTSSNPTLAEGEVGFETDTKKLKIGDGATVWTSLPYFPQNISASQIAFTPTGGIAATDVAAALAELDTEKITNAFTPSGNIAATTLSGAIVELDTEKLATTASFGGQTTGTYDNLTVKDSHGQTGTLTHHARSHDHTNALDGTVAASAITFTATGNIASTTVQTAIAEAASEAVQLTGSPTGGQITGSYSTGLTVANTHGASGVQTHHAQSHIHDGVDGSGTVAHSALTGFATDTATTDIHHTLGTGANQAAAGNHAHTGYLPVLFVNADQSLASNITLTTATPFNITVAASAILTIDYWLPYIAGAGSLKVGWTVPAGGATLTWATADLTAGSTTLTGTQIVVASSTAVQWVRIRAYYVGGTQSGTVSFQWAQNASSTTATVLKKGAWASYLIQ